MAMKRTVAFGARRLSPTRWADLDAIAMRFPDDDRGHGLGQAVGGHVVPMDG
jgi:hypothetical protein